MDADELIDGNGLADWLTHTDVLAQHDVIELAAYTYGVDPSHREFEWCHAGLLIRQEELQRSHLLTADDRCDVLRCVGLSLRWY